MRMRVLGVDVLHSFKASALPSLSKAEILAFVSRIKEAKGQTDTPSNPFLLSSYTLSSSLCEALMSYADREHARAQESKSERDLDDFQLTLTSEQLIEIVGKSVFSDLSSVFKSPVSEIKLRRCVKHKQCINFHLDHSLRTMQVALNASGCGEYEGGRLIYASEANGGEIYFPTRGQGAVTVHDNTLVHGVSTLQSGVRYGLFFLYSGQ